MLGIKQTKVNEVYVQSNDASLQVLHVLQGSKSLNCGGLSCFLALLPHSFKFVLVGCLREANVANFLRKVYLEWTNIS